MDLTDRRLNGRTPQLVAALEAAADPELVTLGLPEEVDGDLDFTFVWRWPGTDELVAWDASFGWDGESAHASFTLDISAHESTSPASSAPITGWATWLTGDRVVAAFESADQEMCGWIDLDGSPFASDEAEDAASDPARWAELARKLARGIAAAGDEEGDRGRMHTRE